MGTIAEVKDEIHRIWRSSFQTELDDALEAELRRSAVVGIKATLESALRAELDRYLGFGRYARQPSGKKPPEYQRSGSYRRPVETEYGPIADLQVPKLRAGNRARPWQILQRYHRARQMVLDKALYLYALGLSLRDLQAALYLFLGRVLSRRAVNQVTLDVQGAMAAWRTAPIAQTPPILIVDGVWVTILSPTGAQWIDRAGHQREEVRGHERVILTVLAVWPDGRHHILHDEVADDEDASTWSTVFQHLIARGLDPRRSNWWSATAPWPAGGPGGLLAHGPPPTLHGP
ncbi:MAG: transposase [Ardenticatenaceae bacterium]|nr:transposase [Ardenticatenaceae bacterium]